MHGTLCFGQIYIITPQGGGGEPKRILNIIFFVNEYPNNLRIEEGGCSKCPEMVKFNIFE